MLSTNIGQRAILACTPAGNVLWDCIALIDDATVDLLKGLGGVAAIAISHPHYYTTMVEWSRAFGGVPIHLHEADRQWVMRADPAVQSWGDTKPIAPGLVRLGGHFDTPPCTGQTGGKVAAYCSRATSFRWSRADTSALCGLTRTLSRSLPQRFSAWRRSWSYSHSTRSMRRFRPGANRRKLQAGGRGVSRNRADPAGTVVPRVGMQGANAILRMGQT